jgi:hypothetical protein
MRRLTHSRMARLERTLGPARTGPPPCPGCGAPDTQGPGYLIRENGEPPPTCDVCRRTLDQQGRPLDPCYMIVLAQESDFPS